MTALPGQRAVQQPLKAAAGVQRALGRAVAPDPGTVAPRGVAILNGVYYVVDLSGGVPRLVPRGTVGGAPAEGEEQRKEDPEVP